MVIAEFLFCWAVLSSGIALLVGQLVAFNGRGDDEFARHFLPDGRMAGDRHAVDLSSPKLTAGWHASAIRQYLYPRGSR